MRERRKKGGRDRGFFYCDIANAIAQHCSQKRGIVWLSESMSEKLSGMESPLRWD